MKLYTLWRMSMSRGGGGQQGRRCEGKEGRKEGRTVAGAREGRKWKRCGGGERERGRRRGVEEVRGREGRKEGRRSGEKVREGWVRGNVWIVGAVGLGRWGGEVGWRCWKLAWWVIRRGWEGEVWWGCLAVLGNNGKVRGCEIWGRPGGGGEEGLE